MKTLMRKEENNMYKVESDFEYNGLRCVVTFGDMEHRCGYVGVPNIHSLYGKNYNDYLEINKADIEGKEVSGVFPLLGPLLDEDERVRIDAFFNCHGGITYAGGGVELKYPECRAYGNCQIRSTYQCHRGAKQDWRNRVTKEFLRYY